MYTETIGSSNGNVTLGDITSTGNRVYQVGICTIDVVGTGAAPDVNIYGKIVESSDDDVDSNWFLLNSWTVDSTNATSTQFEIDMMPSFALEITGNTNNRNIQVTIGYNHKP